MYSSSLVPWQQSINSSPELRVMRESRQSWSDMFLLDSSKGCWFWYSCCFGCTNSDQPGISTACKDALPVFPFCIFTGCVIGVIYILMAIFAGPKLTTMTAFLGALPILVFCIKKGFLMPKDIWTFDGVSE